MKPPTGRAFNTLHFIIKRLERINGGFKEDRRKEETMA
jgi:hypothetical protein